jgi:hypothetical protein
VSEATQADHADALQYFRAMLGLRKAMNGKKH